MTKLNLPNKLTVLRVLLVPVCMVSIMLPLPVVADTWQRIIAAALFIIIAMTDMLDGMIARKRGMITDFGKFLDPLADKFLVIGALLALFIKCGRIDAIFPIALVFSTTIVVMRELAVTSLRLLVANASGTVIAANWLGKVKTVSQMVCIVTILLEPIILGEFGSHFFLSYLSMAFMAFMTLWSGINYCKGYWTLLDPSR